MAAREASYRNHSAGRASLAEGLARLFFWVLWPPLGSETAISGWQESVFLKSFTLASSDAVTRMSSSAGLLRNMKKIILDYTKFPLCLSLWPSDASSGFGGKSLNGQGP